ncbi:MAG: hypothetical protein WC860_06970 [Candidatus Margulisiibacteriota bacterium]
MEKPICFGTSGHRGIIGTDFTTKHVEAIAKAVAEYLKSQSKTPKVCVGYDPRKGNSPLLEEGSFTKSICDCLVAENIEVHFFSDFVPTPVVSKYIVDHKLDGGLILTASHNPPQYNGIKFNLSNGAPASTDVTTIIEEIANNNYYQDITKVDSKDKVKFVDFKAGFVEETLNYLKQITKHNFEAKNFSVVIDAKHGTVGEYWKTFFNKIGLENFDILNFEPRSDFGMIESNPTKLAGLADLKQRQLELNASLAIANDPDGDRHVILDEFGELVTPEEIAVIILNYLASKNMALLGIASTVASSMIIRSANEALATIYYETPVGFKYFSPFLEEGIAQKKIALAVESSGGFTASFHTMEKCGFLPGLFLMFIIQDTNLSLSQLRKEIEVKYGKFYFQEKEYHFPEDKKQFFLNLFKNLNQEDIATKLELDVIDINKSDGLKIILDKAWFLMRLSGTEPIARIYAESTDIEHSKSLLALATCFLNQNC